MINHYQPITIKLTDHYQPIIINQAQIPPRSTTILPTTYNQPIIINRYQPIIIDQNTITIDQPKHYHKRPVSRTNASNPSRSIIIIDQNTTIIIHQNITTKGPHRVQPLPTRHKRGTEHLGEEGTGAMRPHYSYDP